MNEAEIIKSLASIFARPGEGEAGVLLGIGDDAAVIAPSQFPLAVTTDTAVEDVHFKSDWSSYFEIGSKITTANLADIFAMGGQPQYLVVAVAFPTSHLPSQQSNSGEAMIELARGIAAEADRVGARVIGGDVSKSEKLMVTITAMGKVAKTITRSGARIGESVYLSNLTGWSLAGLTCLRQRYENSRAISAYKRPQPDFSKCQSIAQVASAMCDVSDGLLLDASHIADASGCTIEIDPDLIAAIPDYAELVATAKPLGIDPLDWVLQGGEDHELLFTSGEVAPANVWRIGQVIERGETPVRIKGRALPETLGWSHF